jgi:hypothetical protein
MRGLAPVSLVYLTLPLNDIPTTTTPITIVTNHNRYRHYPSLDIHPFQDGNRNGSIGNIITLVFIITSIGIIGINIIGER